MKLSEEEIQKVLELVKKEPRTVQEVAQAIDRSWVTTEKYLQELKARTGIINLKTFREGTQAALKLVYYSPADFSSGDEVKQNLEHQIMTGKQKHDFDFMEVFQFIPEKEKRLFARTVEQERSMTVNELAPISPQKNVHYFSGNLGFLAQQYEGKMSFGDYFERALQNGVHIKVLCRVNLASMKNFERVSHLLVKYPNLFEIHHRYHPLRGMVIDDAFARFKSFENKEDYAPGELENSMRVYYEIDSPEWVGWFQSIFWKMWRGSIDYSTRIREIQKITGA